MHRIVYRLLVTIVTLPARSGRVQHRQPRPFKQLCPDYDEPSRRVLRRTEVS